VIPIGVVEAHPLGDASLTVAVIMMAFGAPRIIGDIVSAMSRHARRV
jgi:hypothetical protein